MSERIKIVNVVGARPNFMKMAPLVEEMHKHSDIQALLVHTGQHYDAAMSKFFFEDLGLPRPDYSLNVGSASHAVQTAKVMEGFEGIVLEEQPDLVLVVGDVNSTIACALTSVKLGVPVAHVEAGLRSFDRDMPEEINRVLTDAISELLFTTERAAEKNLLREGIAGDKIHFVGNVMIDTLLKHKSKAEQSRVLEDMGLESRTYGLVTLHRPSNVDSREILESILQALGEISRELPLVFPCHPRTRKKIEGFGLSHLVRDETGGRIRQCEPLGYLDFLKLTAEARIVFTDSGGIQEETTILGVPCVTLRENTERPITVSEGTNSIVGTDSQKILATAQELLNNEEGSGRIPELWDGKASGRIVAQLRNMFSRVRT